MPIRDIEIIEEMLEGGTLTRGILVSTHSKVSFIFKLCISSDIYNH